jgi:hypothetical protein
LIRKKRIGKCSSKSATNKRANVPANGSPDSTTDIYGGLSWVSATFIKNRPPEL